MQFKIATASLIALALCGPALAQDAPAGSLYMQLNNAQSVGGGCQLTFAVKNDTGTPIQKSSYNVAVINGKQQVSTLITFDFRPLPTGQTKVQQFGLPGQSCEDIAGLSINDYLECTTADGASPLCETAIKPSSLTPIAFPWDLVVK